MSKPTDLDAVQKLCDAATPGPWVRNVDIEEWARQQRHYQGDSIVSGPARTSIATDVQDPPDVRFICSARTLVPQMAAEIRELRAELAAERATVAAATQFNVGPDRWSGVEVIDVYGTGWAVWDRRKAWDSHHGGNFTTRDAALAEARRLASIK